MSPGLDVASGHWPPAPPDASCARIYSQRSRQASAGLVGRSIYLTVALAVSVRADAATAVRDATAGVLHGAGLRHAENSFRQPGSGFHHTESGIRSAVSDETAQAIC